MNETLDYRTALKKCLDRRVSANASYSLRAFARDLKLAPSHLSLVLNGKRGLSAGKASEMFEQLGFSSDERKLYLLQVTKNHARSTEMKQKAKIELAEQLRDMKHFQLTQDAFEVISEWYHFAILQTLSHKNCQNQKTRALQHTFLAKRLSISIPQVEDALARLERLKLIAKGEAGYAIEHDTVFAMSGVPSAALRQFHRAILTQTIDALETQTVEERYPNTIILPVLKSSFPLVRDEMIRFNKRIMKKYGRTVQRDGEETYALTQHFVKLTTDKCPVK